ncbi:hypothetical protein NDU88_006465 [Pleurodeles waltl]|uniref:Uncharacterized protein n=1 Tax=Pleurodeles waltl TaxID=8319 RepID=A0AAV7LFH3_PLEWA|nr:hypothetical protein NDU88_006465 [Pleurodeles waltl]
MAPPPPRRERGRTRRAASRDTGSSATYGRAPSEGALPLHEIPHTNASRASGKARFKLRDTQRPRYGSRHERSSRVSIGCAFDRPTRFNGCGLVRRVTARDEGAATRHLPFICFSVPASSRTP